MALSAAVGGPAAGVSAATSAGAPQTPKPSDPEQERSDVFEDDCRKVLFFDTPEEILAAVKKPLQVVSRAVLVIAAPTSSSAVVKSYLEHAAAVVETYRKGTGAPDGQNKLRILILPGTRIDNSLLVSSREL